jgi:hypothetical protein
VFDEIEIKGNIFMPKSLLNAMRRNFYEAIIKKVSGARERKDNLQAQAVAFLGTNQRIAVIANDFNGVFADIAIYKPNDYTAEYPESFIKGAFEKFVYYPPFCTREDEVEMEKRIKEYALDGVYAENYAALAFAEKIGVKAQYKRAVAGGNDSGEIHKSKGGVRTLAVSLACRYLHSPSCIADKSDCESVMRLVSDLCAQIPGK